VPNLFETFTVILPNSQSGSGGAKRKRKRKSKRRSKGPLIIGSEGRSASGHYEGPKGLEAWSPSGQIDRLKSQSLLRHPDTGPSGSDHHPDIKVFTVAIEFMDRFSVPTILQI
jgi:hypothetical protein